MNSSDTSMTVFVRF